MLVHGSGRLAGGSTLFALCGWAVRPAARHAHFLALLLPHLHLALLRLAEAAARDAPPRAGEALARPLSGRETEILGWVREGKSNYEVGCILGISALTVKNHLQRIYRTLGVSNRTHALSRCLALRLSTQRRRLGSPQVPEQDGGGRWHARLGDGAGCTGLAASRLQRSAGAVLLGQAVMMRDRLQPSRSRPPAIGYATGAAAVGLPGCRCRHRQCQRRGGDGQEGAKIKSCHLGPVNSSLMPTIV
jgi:DNA-binding CsgD family transcriptional regulator